jgi:prophage regulatory protein
MQRKTIFLPTIEILRRTGYSRTTLYNRVKSALFMKPLKLDGRSVVWPEHEVEELLRFMLSEPTQNQIRALVFKIHSRRQSEGAQA